MAKNTKAATAAPEAKSLTVVERAVVALGYNEKTVKDLTTLAAGSVGITAITNDAGYQQCHAARMVLKNTRVEITNRGKSAREDAQKFSKAVIGEESRLIQIIEPEEKRLQGLQDAHDDKIEAEKQRKIQIEIDRVNGIQARIEKIRRMADLPINPEPQYVLDTIGDAETVVVDESFEEFEQQARDAKGAMLALLRDHHAGAIERVADEKRRADEAAELAQLRADKAARDQADRKRAAEEQAGRDEIARVERNRLAAEAQNTGPGGIVVPPAGDPSGPLGVSKGGNTDAAFARLESAAEIPWPPAPTEPVDNFVWTIPPDSEKSPTTVENLGAGLITHIGDERPGFEEIVRAVAWTFETDEATVRTWICENVAQATRAAA